MPTGIRLAALTTLVAVAACSSPAQPTASQATPSSRPGQPINLLVGTWTGQAQALTCAGTACSLWIPYPLPPEYFSLTVIPDGEALRGLLDLRADGDIVVELTGAARPDGSALFAGSARPPAGFHSQTADVEALEIKLDPTSGLTGSYTYSLLWNTGTSVMTGRILSAERRPAGPAFSFAGTWEGDFSVTSVQSCENCFERPGRPHRLNLVIDQSGGRLTATALAFDYLPLSGLAVDRTARLSGESRAPSCLNPGFDASLVCREAITDLSISVDQLGRMTGTITYEREGWSGSSTSPAKPYALKVTGDLYNLMRVY